HRPAHPAALGPVDQELEQGGLPDPGLATQNQNMAMARVDSRHETAQGVAFVLPPPQSAPELARGHALVFHRHPAPDNSSDRSYYGHQGSSELANSPTARPRSSSTPAGVCRPFSNRYLILAAFSGRPEVRKKAASPGPNSSSGGSEAQSSSAFVRATAALSNPAIRRANTSVNPVSPPPGSDPRPTSGWPRIALSPAKRMSVASTNSLPAPRARPRMAEIVTAGTLLSRTRLSRYGCNPVGPGAIDATRVRSAFRSQCAMK